LAIETDFASKVKFCKKLNVSYSRTYLQMYSTIFPFTQHHVVLLCEATAAISLE